MAARAGLAITEDNASIDRPTIKILAIAFLNKIFSQTGFGNRSQISEHLPTYSSNLPDTLAGARTGPKAVSFDPTLKKVE